ncbi:MAG: hypothetical protein H6712_20065 [Myxococcales bacterium]|nr:hypothetical protein [Myxococcales bacterium]MCB9716173.1 hypothetical protein [Myxococcales bacterium]
MPSTAAHASSGWGIIEHGTHIPESGEQKGAAPPASQSPLPMHGIGPVVVVSVPSSVAVVSTSLEVVVDSSPLEVSSLEVAAVPTGPPPWQPATSGSVSITSDASTQPLETRFEGVQGSQTMAPGHGAAPSVEQ